MTDKKHTTANMTNASTLTQPPAESKDDAPLFPTTLISPSVAAELPEGYKIRPVRRSDYSRGYLDVLRVLTTVGTITEEQWNKRYDWISSRNDEYYLLVICDGEDRIVGTGSLIVERKFIHELGLVGHIEDIAVDKSQQGKKLGLRIIQALDYVAAQVGCYKVCSSFFLQYILRCGDDANGVCACRVFSIAPRRMRDFISSVGLSVLDWRWLIIIRWC